VNDELRVVLGTALDARVEAVTPVSGGDIHQAYRVVLGDGRCVFVKANTRLGPSVFRAEARGLDWLRAADALRIPRVLAVSDDTCSVGFLVLELLEARRPRPDFDERLGRGLAELHRAEPRAFGLDHDNFIGPLPQANGSLPSWVEFYGERRLQPQFERAVRAGLLSPSLVRSFERLFVRLTEFVGPPESPARLHGDLWSGNLLVGPEGEPCLVDPACYGGHREVDLAMMRLFGGFSERVFAAYGETYPLASGHETRVPLYQLYPLLVHVNLFGGGYGAALERAMEHVLG
jgi:fructosamine-3-kinase